MKAPMSTDELLEMMNLETEQEKEQYLDKICDREIDRLTAEKKKNVEDMEILYYDVSQCTGMVDGGDRKHPYLTKKEKSNMAK